MAAANSLETLTGYFLPSNQQCQEADDDDYDLSDDEDWKDFDDLSGGGSGLSGKPLRKEKCTFSLYFRSMFQLSTFLRNLCLSSAFDQGFVSFVN